MNGMNEVRVISDVFRHAPKVAFDENRVRVDFDVVRNAKKLASSLLHSRPEPDGELIEAVEILDEIIDSYCDVDCDQFSVVIGRGISERLSHTLSRL